MKNKRPSKVPAWMKKANQAMNEMHKALGEGKTEAVQAVLDGMARLSKYSPNNQMLIMLQRENVRHVRGYVEWQNHGRQVRSGEKGLFIIAPRFKKDKVTGEILSRWFVGSSVFDISQTDGPDIEEVNIKVDGDPGAEMLEAIEAVIKSDGITLSYVADIPGGALGVSKTGAIDIIDSLDAGNRFRVLVHELAHEKMHKGADRRLLTQEQKECEAECVAAAICSAVGMSSHDTHRDYVQLYNADVKLFELCLTRIQTTIKAILKSIDGTMVPAEVAA